MNIAAQFENYLREVKNVSKNTIRFYRSDLNHFSNWLIEQLKPLGVLLESIDEAIPYLNNKTVEDYKNNLIGSGVALKTINRRLSTLRIYSSFLASEGHIQSDFASEVVNLSESTNKKVHDYHEPVLGHFELYLKKQGASANTVKNYMADIKQFFDWMNISANTSN
ncbi:site-specific integrase [Candidatus Microgenomates bacterium]|nr:site-specific integrase [Candidatus Microgenomates bacterium]